MKTEINLMEERVGKILEDIGVGKNFKNKTPTAQQLSQRTNKWDLILLKSFCTARETTNRVKRQPAT